jgi:serine/threonine protein kinase
LTRERWAQIRQVFDGALDRPAKDRAAYLRVVCARDNELRLEVESLLRSHDQSEDFLSTPAAQLGQLLSRDDDAAEYPQGYCVGPYRLERRIGRGGMGSVWLATRVDEAYNKEVAIKLVKRGMDSQEILRRFRVERQVLANLDHPNIARLIDGGSTPEGLPYLVMEYVQGTRIDQYCEQHRCSITERLQAFRALCSAVHYAHQNLVVHRDIKAGNILVTADGVPKLLDFGIAKLLRHDGSTLDLAQTRPELRPMTLDYASPEQIRGEPITTASDVYSLGVLLYKLLTGKMPYGSEPHSQAALQHAICETEPPRPSALVLADEKTAIPEATQKMEAMGESRDKARKRLRKKLAGDLDNIILMAMRKEPHRRYRSVEQFSEDIGRYLEGRPVIARLETPGYQLAKFVTRNAEGVAAAVVVGAALISIAAFSEHYASAAIEAEARAEQTLQQTRHQLVGAYLRAGAAQPAWDTAQVNYQVNPADIVARRDLAQAATAMGDASLARNDLAGAATRYTDALTQYEAVAQMNTSDLGAQRDVMLAARKLGAVQTQGGNFSGALASYNRALQIAEGLATLEGSQVSVATREEVAEANRRVGELLLRNGGKEAGTAKLRKALQIYQELSDNQLISTQAVAELAKQLGQ